MRSCKLFVLQGRVASTNQANVERPKVGAALAVAIAFCPTVLAMLLFAQAPPAPVIHAVDHVILRIDDLERGRHQFEALTGVLPAMGGRHPCAGTQNALVALGNRTYLEIVARVPGAASPSTAQRLAAFSTLTPTGWAVRTPDAHASAALLRANGYVVRGPSDGSRATPDGRILRWTTLSIALAESRRAPFLIEWDSGSPHPATTSPTGCTLDALTIWEARPPALNGLLRTLGVDVRVEQGEPGIRVALKCPKGRVEIGPSSGE